MVLVFSGLGFNDFSKLVILKNTRTTTHLVLFSGFRGTVALGVFSGFTGYLVVFGKRNCSGFSGHFIVASVLVV